MPRSSTHCRPRAPRRRSGRFATNQVLNQSIKADKLTGMKLDHFHSEADAIDSARCS
jgi:hypothetical protein